MWDDDFITTSFNHPIILLLEDPVRVGLGRLKRNPVDQQAYDYKFILMALNPFKSLKKEPIEEHLKMLQHVSFFTSEYPYQLAFSQSLGFPTTVSMKSMPRRWSRELSATSTRLLRCSP